MLVIAALAAYLIIRTGWLAVHDAVRYSQASACATADVQGDCITDGRATVSDRKRSQTFGVTYYYVRLRNDANRSDLAWARLPDSATYAALTPGTPARWTTWAGRLVTVTPTTEAHAAAGRTLSAYDDPRLRLRRELPLAIVLAIGWVGLVIFSREAQRLRSPVGLPLVAGAVVGFVINFLTQDPHPVWILAATVLAAAAGIVGQRLRPPEHDAEKEAWENA